MKKFVFLFVILSLCIIGCASVFAESDVTVVSPDKDSYTSDEQITLSAQADDCDYVVFYLDGEKIETFYGDSKPTLELSAEQATFGKHIFSVKAFKKGGEVVTDKKEFLIQDSTAIAVHSDNFNSFAGIAGSEYGFVSNNYGEVMPGEGKDGSTCIKFQATKINDSDSYLPFMNFSMTNVSDALTIEMDILVSDYGLRLMFETNGVYEVMRYSMIGNKAELEPDTWYNLKTVLDYKAKMMKVYLDGDEVISKIITASSSGTAPRLTFASADSNDGYMLIDNMSFSRMASSPSVKSSYYKNAAGSQAVITDGVVPSDAAGIGIYFDGELPSDIGAAYNIAYYINGERAEIENIDFKSAGKSIYLTFAKMPNSGEVGKLVFSSSMLDKDISYTFKMPESISYTTDSHNIEFIEQLADDDSLEANIIVKNDSDEEKVFTLIICSYKDDELTAISHQKCSVSANGQAEAETGTINAANADSIECFVISSWDELSPLPVMGSLKTAE